MTSANIVGYNKADLVNGFGLGGPCFTPVAKESFSIQELIPVDSEGEVQYGAVFQLQTKKSTGSPDQMFVFLNGEDDIGDDTYPNGWYLDDYDTFATKVFKPGEGFLFTSTVTGGHLTFTKMAL